MCGDMLLVCDVEGYVVFGVGGLVFICLELFCCWCVMFVDEVYVGYVED